MSDDGTPPMPDAAEPGQTGIDIGSILQDINTELVGLHTQSRFLNEVIDKLHTENERLRRNESQKLLEPMIRDLIKLVDDWRSRGSAMRDVTEADSADLVRLCGEIVEDVTMVLDRQGVAEFAPPHGNAFDRHVHRAAGTRPTQDSALDGVVCEVRRPGYRSTDKTLRFAEVTVLKFTGES
ncbi:nucleotide exchange factor GrpE [Solihabitans fulvus]|uniref:nucleotide exchange factor GrpE n=1 Tax=Solihabitans fulvus TaxID=1892852 RepID=UPI001661CD0B|nr:nucleotide exchange factor GrpE [Solihabitans fulvus]